MPDSPVKFVDNPFARETYASAATGFSVAHGNVTITFEAPRVDHATSPGPVSRVVVGRIVMPPSGAQALAIGLFEFLEKQGFDFKRGQAS